MDVIYSLVFLSVFKESTFMKNAQQVMAKPWKNKNHPCLIIWQVRVSHISILTVCKIHLKSQDSINELYDFLQFIFIKYQRKNK